MSDLQLLLKDAWCTDSVSIGDQIQRGTQIQTLPIAETIVLTWNWSDDLRLGMYTSGPQINASRGNSHRRSNSTYLHLSLGFHLQKWLCYEH